VIKLYTYESESISQTGSCSDDPIVLSNEESYFNNSDDYMSSDEEPIERRIVHRGMKNMFEVLYIYTTSIRLIPCLSFVI
jgi:hypothetical protein